MSREQLALDLEPEPPRQRRTEALDAFHVRGHMPPAEALAGERKASAQDELILRVFRRAGERMTPSQVLGVLHDDFPPAPLLTSVRRSITNLTKRGLLVHHEADRRPGPHGATESVWGLPEGAR